MDNLSSLDRTLCSKGNNDASMSNSEFKRSRCRFDGLVLTAADVLVPLVAFWLWFSWPDCWWFGPDILPLAVCWPVPIDNKLAEVAVVVALLFVLCKLLILLALVVEQEDDNEDNEDNEHEEPDDDEEDEDDEEQFWLLPLILSEFLGCCWLFTAPFSNVPVLYCAGSPFNWLLSFGRMLAKQKPKKRKEEN